MEFQLNYLKSQKMMLLKCYTQYITNLDPTQLWPQGWKMSVFLPIPKKGNAKEYSNHHKVELISYASKLMLKIHQARLQQHMNKELPAKCIV